mmetsp:Transcript_10309/g.23274  ORF Transcript_10309/g.23274 Transcript_10309/m.23274 type:complete len:802 (-) Transcript_10309:95-2500(-)|eukprot:CAMPEP_0197940746 /NCGR_PEP_ID=MMETSP1439-20131203/121717_1 /TAXON_ID=66791 /ORGANISM="Gonyaulax spinifera, Strain CCMP409" /LENGTH=801 /DNA_ID=CAMNT_0043563923 /DNA_START=56 /DNA_END=2461 /DNA_ORIENTATION=-
MILALVLVVWLGLAFFAMKLSSTTTTSFSAAPGTRSYVETDKIKTTFPSAFNDRETAVILCRAPADCSCKSPTECPGFKAIFDGLRSSLGSFASDGTLSSTTSYFDFTDNLAPLGHAYYNSSASSMQVSLQFDKGSGIDGEAKVTAAMTKAIAAGKDLSKMGWTVLFSGQVAATLFSTKEIGPLIGASDGTGMIFIVLLFGWQVRSWRLCWIPVINTIICLLMAQGLIYPLSKSGVIVLPSYVPNVCLFLSIALSVDYSFFHLSRFQEVRREGKDLQDAVEEMVTAAGRVVLVSGVVLLFCWLALAAFPVFGTNTLGYCSAITIFCCISVNLLMNPAMILAFPTFFGKASQDPWHCCRRRRTSDGEAAGAPLVEDLDGAESKGCYAAIGRAATTMPGMLLLPLLVYALLMPGVIRLFTADFVVGGVAGGSSSTTAAEKHLLEDFSGSGSGVPLTVMLSAPSGVSVSSEQYFLAGADLANTLQEETGFTSSCFRGVMIDGAHHSANSLQFYNYSVVNPMLHSGTIYNWGWGLSVNPANTSSLLIVTPPYDAFSNEAKALVTQARAAVTRFNALPGRGAYVVAATHPMAIEVDAETLTVGRFPVVVAITVFVVFSLIGVRYKAALIPFKLLFTIAVPIMSTLGMGVFVFQDGVLNWTGIPSLQSDGGLVWINPVACTFMLIGFGLDYDIFLFSRIYAARKSGRFTDDREAIVSAVAATGPVISTAGCIMALAFIGMIVQHSNEFLCQMGFTMIFGVLMDTFVVRTLLVPAFLAMAGRFNWWPGKMPLAPMDARDIEVSLEPTA